MIRLLIALPLFLLLALAGCSDSSSDAPPAGAAHPAGWVQTHSAEASIRLDGCQVCHGIDFAGSGDAVSCFSCHVYNQAPPFSIHPADWTDTYVDHRAFAATNGFTSCAIAACHGADQHLPLGGTTGPSCASATFTNSAGQTRSCHAEGPSLAPHPLDGSYLSGAVHGVDAKADLTICQGCHGQPGGPGSNPRFNVGIESAGVTGCEACHGANYAHPAAWAGPNATFHYSAGNQQGACSLCHGVNLDGVGCISCHAAPPSGTIQPNRLGSNGRHSRGAHQQSCDVCHTNNGPDASAAAANHFTRPATANAYARANLRQAPNVVGTTMTITQGATNVTCTGSCHGTDKNHNENWY